MESSLRFTDLLPRARPVTAQVAPQVVNLMMDYEDVT
jgi:hypothetical protein